MDYGWGELFGYVIAMLISVGVIGTVTVLPLAWVGAKLFEWRHESGETERDELEYMLRDWLRDRERSRPG